MPSQIAQQADPYYELLQRIAKTQDANQKLLLIILLIVAIILAFEIAERFKNTRLHSEED